MAKSVKIKGLAVVAMYVSPGVSRGAGGFVIVNGKVIKVPPRGPAFRQVQAALQAIAAIGRRGGR
jgi:hypothetical protein